MRLRRFQLVAIACAMLPLLAGARRSAAQGADNLTLHFSDEVAVVPANNPCYGHIVGTLTFSGVLHINEGPNGSHSVFAIHGTANVDPANPNIPGFDGGFSEVQVSNLNRTNSAESFVVTQRGANGMAFHITFHAVVDYPNTVRVSVLNFVCGQ